MENEKSKFNDIPRAGAKTLPKWKNTPITANHQINQ